MLTLMAKLIWLIYLFSTRIGARVFITAMEPLKDGRFKITLELDKGNTYQFRYLVDKSEWHNDWEADRYVANPFSGDNSIVET